MEDSNKLKEKLQGFIMSPEELAEKMTNGEFKYYQVVDMKALEKEAFEGGVSREEFRQIIFADLRARFVKNGYAEPSIYNI